MFIRSAPILIAGLLALAGLAHAQPSVVDSPLLLGKGLCGELANNFGPYDYRKHPDKHAIVENFHFTPQVEALRKGQSSIHLGGDIGYTLRAFPNHPRALYAMARYGLQLGVTQVRGAQYPVECYFDRALRFTPDDAQVRALYADYLIRTKRKEDARKQLEAAERLELTPQIAYNVALAWTNLGENEKALPLAKQAYGGGVNFPGLKERLTRAGVWK
jgi:tetratricopeptide (TPR) repeat protein